MIRQMAIGAMIAAALCGISGCYTPGGGLLSSVNGPSTYQSTQLLQQSVSIVDLRTNEVIFALDIPPLKQLVIEFEKGEGDDPVMTPDLMRYEVMDLGESTGKLSNSMTMPAETSRRIDLHVRQRVEFAEAPPMRALRTDELADRPDWWTPRGGPMPVDRQTNLYDD